MLTKKDHFSFKRYFSKGFIPCGLACALIGILSWLIVTDSYKILYTNHTSFEKIWVYEKGNERCLSFVPPGHGARQTCIALDSPHKLVLEYQRLMMGALLFAPPPRTILMIGLGGGTLVSALHTLLPHTSIDVVEVNPLIAKIATRYFYLPTNPTIRIHIADGFDFLNDTTTAKQYDFIFIDAFTEDYIPSTFLTKRFVNLVKDRLTTQGIAVVNTFTRSPHAILENALYKDAFGPFYTISRRNRIIIAAKAGFLTPPNTITNDYAQRWHVTFQRLGIDVAGLQKMITFIP